MDTLNQVTIAIATYHLRRSRITTSFHGMNFLKWDWVSVVISDTPYSAFVGFV